MENKNESKDRADTPKFRFIIVLFCVLAVASLIVIILLVLKTDNHYNDYYISDYISELEEETGRKLVYRKVNTNIEHYICELNERVKRIHVRYKNR